MARLTRYAWFVLVFNVGVILLGALVRATGSGAGCGRSWPTCQGSFVPELEGATLVEFTHRAASGVALLLVFVLAVLVWRSSERGDPVRTGAVISVVAIVGEALIGAMIVLADWVADDTSIARVVAVPLHRVNTLVLLAALTLTVFWLSGGGRLRWSDAPSRVRRGVVLAGVGLVLLAATGAVTALADTLFPKGGDLTGEAHFLTSLRVVHPVLALVVVASAWAATAGSGPVRQVAWWMPILVGLMVLSGVLNVWLGVPIWMQLVHLALADALWVVYVVVSAGLLAGGFTGGRSSTAGQVPGAQPGLQG